VPRVWQFLDQLPQTASGMVQNFALRETFTPKSQPSMEGGPALVDHALPCGNDREEAP
jgi:hypothetical protein